MVNKAAGKGYENTDHYNNVDYQFYNIQNIHAMRESLQKMIEGKYMKYIWSYLYYREC